MRWKGKKERTSETANCISLQKRRYILCQKTIFTTKHKTLKKQKKAKRQHLKTMDCDLFFCWSNSFLFFRKKMYINGGVKKKRYQRWGEKHNNFFGNFFINLASCGGRLKLVLNVFFLAKQHILFFGEVNSFFCPTNTRCCCCKWFQVVANDIDPLQMVLQMTYSWLQKAPTTTHEFCKWLMVLLMSFAHEFCSWLLMDNFALVTSMVDSCQRK